MVGQKLDEKKLMEDRMNKLDRDDLLYIKGSKKPVNAMYTLHFLEDDVHNTYKVGVKT